MRPTTHSTRLVRTLPHAVPALGLSFALLASTGLTDPALSQELSVQVPEVSVQAVPPSLTVPTAEEARTEIQRTPGGVAVIPDTVLRNTPARTIKDIVEWTPGVIVQPRFGADARLSIRGSGLSRNYGNRGLNVFMDGIPVNTSDGLVDFFEIDPSAYRYVEVFKGSNALRLGSNALGGAINLVTPTGRDVSPSSVRLDAGSYGYVRAQASTGGVSGPFDFFVTGAAQRQDGFREHSRGDDERASGNIGYQFSPDAETRFYLNVNKIRQRIPGEMTQSQALRSPRSANPEWIRQDQARNIDSVRFANKTTLRFGATTVEFGAFGVNRHVMHPIFQYLDYTVWDYGGFARAVDDRTIGGFRNRLTVGANLHYGRIDTDQYVNLTGAVKGPLAASMVDTSQNLSIYAENSFFMLPQLSLVVGAQFLHAVRERRDRFLADGDGSGRRNYDLFSPKVGVLWDVDIAWQVYGNVSRSAEVPTFDANTFTTPSTSDLRAQTATTYEIGTRGSRGDVTWDVSLYRSQIRNELQCLTTSPFSPCSVVNAGRTVHQGVEAGLGVAFFKSALVPQDRFQFNAAYTLNDFFFDGDERYGNNQLPGVPRHYLRAELLYSHPSGLRAGPNVEWAPGSYYADNANQLRVDPYALLNFRVSFDRGMGLSGYVEARNLTDKRYISSVAIAGTANATSEIFNPGTGRAVYGGLSYRW